MQNICKLRLLRTCVFCSELEFLVPRFYRYREESQNECPPLFRKLSTIVAFSGLSSSKSVSSLQPRFFQIASCIPSFQTLHLMKGPGVSGEHDKIIVMQSLIAQYTMKR